MKKTLCFVLLGSLFLFPATSKCREISTGGRGLFVSVIQEPPVLSSRQEIKKLIDFSKKARVKILFIQIYRANKSWFASKVADSEPYETCLKKVSEDPLRLLIKEAHASGIQVHAWLNLMSLSANEKAPILKKYGPVILTRNLKEKKVLADYKIDNQYFLEPGDPRVRRELSNLVGEIVRAYPSLDGIQFDYIRYPDKNPFYGYTRINLDRFKKTTGRAAADESDSAWKDWRRDQVTELLEILVKKARQIHPGMQVSTTGLTAYSRAYHESFQDWQRWIKSGLVDFVTLMCYTKDTKEFEKDIADAKNKLGDLKKMNIAVGAYKFLDSPENFKRQFEICEGSASRGCAVLHYGNLLQNAELAGPLLDGERSKSTPR